MQAAKGGEENKQCKIAVISMPNTIVYPRTVMVHFHHTPKKCAQKYGTMLFCRHRYLIYLSIFNWALLPATLSTMMRAGSFETITLNTIL